jgi:hypothetical protein
MVANSAIECAEVRGASIEEAHEQCVSLSSVHPMPIYGPIFAFPRPPPFAEAFDHFHNWTYEHDLPHFFSDHILSGRMMCFFLKNWLKTSSWLIAHQLVEEL